MKTIPNFSTFALTNKDQNVINVVTGKVKSYKTGTNKYQLFDDKKKSHTLTLEQIKQLVNVPEIKVEKAAPVKKEKVVKEKKIKVDFVPSAAAKKIIDSDVPKAHKMQPLADLGLTTSQISKSLNTNYAYVYNFLTGYYSKNR